MSFPETTRPAAHIRADVAAKVRQLAQAIETAQHVRNMTCSLEVHDSIDEALRRDKGETRLKPTGWVTMRISVELYRPSTEVSA